MNALFYVSGAVAVISALLVITRINAAHALLNLIVMLIAVSSVFWTLGAPFAAVLQIAVYAGAIMVLFLFVVMILNIGVEGSDRERSWISGLVWLAPVLLTVVLLMEFIFALVRMENAPAAVVVGPKAVGISLFTSTGYLIGVELASILLLAALIAAYHFGMLPRLERSQ